MKKISLLLCLSVAALSLATGSALAQSERTAPGGGAGGGAGAAERAGPPSGAEGGGRMESGKGERMERMDDSGRSAGEAPRGERGKSEARDESSPSKKHGDTAKSDDMKSKGDAKHKDAADSGSKASGSKKEGSAATGASEGTSGADKSPSGSVTQLSGEQRTKAQSAFRSHKSEAVVKDIDISINVGVAVPRSVTLYAVPEDVVIIVPAYKRYKYFIYDDKVVIVDPGTYEIIDVLILA